QMVAEFQRLQAALRFSPVRERDVETARGFVADDRQASAFARQQIQNRRAFGDDAPNGAHSFMGAQEGMDAGREQARISDQDQSLGPKAAAQRSGFYSSDLDEREEAFRADNPGQFAPKRKKKPEPRNDGFGTFLGAFAGPPQPP